MKKENILFTDVDGTLCFHEEIHGIKKISQNDKNLVIVCDPKTNTQNIAIDISNNYYNVYIGLKTQSLIKKISKKCDIIYVTGGRLSTVLLRKNILTYNQGIILENGGIILDKNYNVDEKWNQRLKPELEYLNNIKIQLLKKGWNLDIEGRKTQIRIRTKDNLKKSLKNLLGSLKLPKELKITSNLDSIDIIPISSGKENAIKYLLKKSNFKKTIGIGDDINDLNMLKLTNESYVLGSSYPKVLTEAKKNDWYISKNIHFKGIDEILEKVLFNCD